MKIAFIGDVALFGKNSIDSGYDWKTKFKAVKAVFDTCDYVIGNLETPLTNEKKEIGGKSAYIKGSPDNVEILKYLGINYVSLANNHMFDFGKKGLDETIKVLEDNGIKWYGAYDKSEYIIRNENRISIDGYCCFSANGRGMWDNEKYINVLDPLEVEKRIYQNEQNEFFPVLSCHWGDEHIRYPRYDHILLSRYFAKNHKLLMPCHHPHIIQGYEVISDSLVVYSLGNFCFDDIYTRKSEKPLLELQEYNRQILVLIAEFNNNSISGFEMKPFYFSDTEYIPADGLFAEIDKWSSALKMDILSYETNRNMVLSKYLSNRKENRNIEWYIKRLNYESYRMIKGARKNRIAYARYMTDFLNN